MIIGHSNDTIFIGLSRKNIDQLLQEKPVIIDVDKHGVDKRILIAFGETEDSIAAELKRAGVTQDGLTQFVDYRKNKGGEVLASTPEPEPHSVEETRELAEKLMDDALMQMTTGALLSGLRFGLVRPMDGSLNVAVACCFDEEFVDEFVKLVDKFFTDKGGKQSGARPLVPPVSLEPGLYPMGSIPPEELNATEWPDKEEQ